MSKWPEGQDYAQAVQNPQNCFHDEELKAARPSLNKQGLPFPLSGQFATVFQMLHPSGRVYAVRCMIRHVPGQAKRYEAIAATLGGLNAQQWTVGFDYQTQGIRVGGQWYPIVKMEWVHGMGLDRWIADNLRSQQMRDAAQQFYDLFWKLQNSHIAHGDLSHSNILVERGKLRLVDYDGVYVPALAGKPPGEAGHPNYQHPDRAASDYGPQLDNFSAWVIYGSLVALSVEPGLWARLGGGDDCLLLTREDLRDIGHSPKIEALRTSSDPLVRGVASAWMEHLTVRVQKVPPLMPLLGEKPSEPRKPWWQVPGTSGGRSTTTSPSQRPKWSDYSRNFAHVAHPGRPTSKGSTPAVQRIVGSSRSRPPIWSIGVESPARPVWLYGPSTQTRSSPARQWRPVQKLLTRLALLRLRILGVRGPLTGIGGLALIIVIVLALHSIPEGRRHRPSARPTTTPKSTTATVAQVTYTHAQESLLSHVTTVPADSCIPGADESLREATASIQCNIPSLRITFRYYQYASSTILKRAYNSYLSGFQHDGKMANHCDGKSSGNYTPSTTSKTVNGLWMCYYGDVGNRPEACEDWIDFPSNIYTYACQWDGNFTSLYQWWTKYSGP
jgi:hypothetical protein